MYKSYDHRLKLLIMDTADLDPFKRLGIPVSTMRTWRRDGISSNFITLDIFDDDKNNLCKRIIALEHELIKKGAKIDLLTKL